jgi:hypothetical protein
MKDHEVWRRRYRDFLTESVRFTELTAKFKVYFGSWRLWWEPKGIPVPPECLQTFNRIAQEAVKAIPISNLTSELEPWMQWLEFMRRREWRGLRVTGHLPVSELVWKAGVKIGRPPVVVRRELGLSTGDEPDADHWLEDLTLEHVFRESAEFCDDLARTLELLELKAADQTGATEGSGAGLVHRATASTPVVDPKLAQVPPAKRKRGRRPTISDENKERAAKIKASGGTNKDAAAVLYGTRYPSLQQTKNVSSILRHHKKKSKTPVKPAAPSRKPNKMKG